MSIPGTQSQNARAAGAANLTRLRCCLGVLAVLMLAGASAHSGALALRDTWRAFKAGTPDFAVAYSQRMKGARALLPARGTVGYASDSNDEGEFYLTQYLLVPLILEKGQRPDLVLVNNHVPKKPGSPTADYVISESADGSKAYDFENGIKLIDRRPQR